MLGIPAGPRRRRCAPAPHRKPRSPRRSTHRGPASPAARPGLGPAGVPSAFGVTLVGGCCDGSPGISHVPVAICPPLCPVSRGVPKTRSPAAKALGLLEKGFLPSRGESSRILHQPWGWRPYPPTQLLREGLGCPKFPRRWLGSSRLTECLPRQEVAGSCPGGTLPALMDARGEPWERCYPYLQWPPAAATGPCWSRLPYLFVFQQKWPWISLPVARGLGLAAGAEAHALPALGAGRDGEN